MTRITATEPYEARLRAIEDFIFESTGSVDQVEKFASDHLEAIEFLKHNPRTPAVHPDTGDRTWPFGNGRYRLFFVMDLRAEEQEILLTDIIDNRMANLDIYPGNSMPTYDE